MKIKFDIRILCAVVSILFLFACGGGGGGGGEDTYTTKPTITSVKLFQFWTDEGGVIEQSEFNIGDSFRVEIIANDPDLDMRTLYASEFLLPNIDTPYRTYDAILPPQDKTQMEYWTEWGTIEGPSGNYKACFWIVDRAGNESNEFCINVVVGGSGGGGGRIDPPIASISVTSPTAGSQWQRGTTQTIQWTTSGSVGNVQLQLSDRLGNYT